MSKKKLIVVTSILLLCNAANAQSSLIEEFGEKAAIFIGTCLGTEFLKKKFCQSMTALDHKVCISEAITMLPSRMRVEFEYAVYQHLSSFYQTLPSSIDRGYRSVLSNFGQNRSEACAAYGASMHTEAQMKKLDMRKIAAQIR